MVDLYVSDHYVHEYVTLLETVDWKAKTYIAVEYFGGKDKDREYHWK